MIAELTNVTCTMRSIDEALTNDTCVDFFHANSNFLVEWVRQQKNAADGVHQPSFQQLFKLLERLLEGGRLQPPCDNLLVLLNNMFCLDGAAVERLLFNKSVLETLRSMVVEFCQRYTFLECSDSTENKDPNPKVHFQLYSTIYFVAMLICQNNRRGDDLILRKHFFSHSLVRAILEIDVPSSSKSDIFKLMSIIMVFMVKRVVYANQWSLIKKACFQHLHHLKDSKTIFNYMYCMRSVLLHEPVSTHEIMKYKLLEFVSTSLNYPVHQYHVGCALDSLKLLYSKNQYAKSKFAETELVRHVREQFEEHATVSMGLIEEIWECLPLEQAADLYKYFYGVFLQSKELKRQALKICSVLMQRFSQKTLFEILEDGILDRLEELLRSQATIRSVEVTLKIVEFLLERFKKESPEWYPCLLSKLWSMQLLQLAASWGFHLKDLVMSIQKRHSVF